jgi:hypothetical protein
LTPTACCRSKFKRLFNDAGSRGGLDGDNFQASVRSRVGLACGAEGGEFTLDLLMTQLGGFEVRVSRGDFAEVAFAGLESIFVDNHPDDVAGFRHTDDLFQMQYGVVRTSRPSAGFAEREIDLLVAGINNIGRGENLCRLFPLFPRRVDFRKMDGEMRLRPGDRDQLLKLVVRGHAIT